MGRALSRAAVTRAALLAAAREVFTANGFSGTSIADVVAAAGASVGGLYHHFDGKADLFLALFQEYDERQEARAAAAVRAARSTETASAADLFAAGARAYLSGCWEERDLARLFLAGDGPPGFDTLARQRYRTWHELNHRLMHTAGDMAGDALILVLTGIAREGGREVAVADTAEAADAFVEAILVLIARVLRP